MRIDVAIGDSLHISEWRPRSLVSVQGLTSFLFVLGSMRVYLTVEFVS